MIQPTREELINFMKKHGAENVDSITDEQSAIRHFRAQSKVLKTNVMSTRSNEMSLSRI
ncbi:TPA: hypothetical protein ACOG3W_002241 [Staphylococcus aureus]|nr:hypothetical protein [Staphylococcus aureus]HDJ2197175.1 hypothetical protein [Staphylococcus aureus]HDJ4533708.1 hypothetical protein [Staphylococcus aureus]